MRRTTIRLDDQLLKEAKRLAADSGTTLTAVIEESLRARLYRARDRGVARSPVRLKTSGAGGLQPGIDLDDSAALIEAMENAP